MVAKKGPHPVDVYVGSRVRMRRMLVGMSQDKLGESLGLTFQQVQKYEKGANRIGASRLYQIGKILNVPVAYFYEGVVDENDDSVEGFAEAQPAPSVMEFIGTSEGLQLFRYFAKIEDQKVRRKVIELLRTLADETEQDNQAVENGASEAV